jgi:4-diphosphocytidyl-2-C-methyl-D-erythritol kinase
MKLRVYCPAKLNLFLAVGQPDARRYHPVRTIMQAISLYDILDVDFEGGAATAIEIVGAEVAANNTVTKALRLGQEVFAISPSRVRLEKHIPMESGLGGGSSDAAGILRALSHVRAAPKAELEGLAAAIGVDVPFFLTGGRARGEGYGEQITSMPNPPEEWYLLVKPAVGCPTAEMFAKLDEKPRAWLDWPNEDALYNDFERVAPSECLDLIERLISLGARDAGLSGSGSAVFGRFANAAEAQAAQAAIEESSWVVKGLTRTDSLRIDLIG